MALAFDTNFTRSGKGNLRLDEVEDVRSSGFCKLDATRHGNLRGLYDVEWRQLLASLAPPWLRPPRRNFHQLLSEVLAEKQAEQRFRRILQAQHDVFLVHEAAVPLPAAQGLKASGTRAGYQTR